MRCKTWRIFSHIIALVTVVLSTQLGFAAREWKLAFERIGPDPNCTPLASTLDSHGNTFGVFKTSRSGVAKFDPAGNLLWQRECFLQATSNQVIALPPVLASNGTVFVLYMIDGTSGTDGFRLYAFDEHSGKKLWCQTGSAFVNQLFYVARLHVDSYGDVFLSGILGPSGYRNSSIIKFEGGSGRRLWEFKVAEDHLQTYVQNSILTSSGRLFVTGEWTDRTTNYPPLIYELNPQTGQIVRQFSVQTYSDLNVAPAAIAEFEGTLVVGYDEFDSIPTYNNFCFMRFTMEGIPMWSTPISIPCFTVPAIYESVTVQDSVIFRTSRIDANLPYLTPRAICIDPRSKTIKWDRILTDSRSETELPYQVSNSTSFARNHDLFFSSDNVVARLDHQTGNVLSQIRIGTDRFMVTRNTDQYFRGFEYRWNNYPFSDVVAYSGTTGDLLYRKPVHLDFALQQEHCAAKVDDRSAIVGTFYLDRNYELKRIDEDRNILWTTILPGFAVSTGRSTNRNFQDCFLVDLVRNRILIRGGFFDTSGTTDSIIALDISSGNLLDRYNFPPRSTGRQSNGPPLKMLSDGSILAHSWNTFVRLSPNFQTMYTTSVEDFQEYRFSDTGWVIGKAWIPGLLLFINSDGVSSQATLSVSNMTLYDVRIDITPTNKLALLVAHIGFVRYLIINPETGMSELNVLIPVPGESTSERGIYDFKVLPDGTLLSKENSAIEPYGNSRIVKRLANGTLQWQILFGPGQPIEANPEITGTRNSQELYVSWYVGLPPVYNIFANQWRVDALNWTTGQLSPIVNEPAFGTSTLFETNSNRLWKVTRELDIDHTVPTLHFVRND
jgi:outer membrane protein assembly factor BamB